MIGKYREKIKIINFSTISDGQGGLVATERVDIEVWAKIIPMSGSRGIDASQIVLDQTYEIHIRYEDYACLSKKNWIKYQNRILVVHAYQIIEEKRKFIKIIAREDAGRDEIIYDENYQPLYDENGNYITIE